jgi:hypothetical protein
LEMSVAGLIYGLDIVIVLKKFEVGLDSSYVADIIMLQV